MTDDLDALLARADDWRWGRATTSNPDLAKAVLIEDLAAAVRSLRTDYDTALDVIADGQEARHYGSLWPSDVLTDAKRKVWRDAATRRRAVLAAAETRHNDL